MKEDEEDGGKEEDEGGEEKRTSRRDPAIAEIAHALVRQVYQTDVEEGGESGTRKNGEENGGGEREKENENE